MDWGDSSSGSEILFVEIRKQGEECELHGYFSGFEAAKNWLNKKGFSRKITIYGETAFLEKFPPSSVFNNAQSPFAILTDEQEKQAAYVYKMCRIDETTLPA